MQKEFEIPTVPSPDLGSSPLESSVDTPAPVSQEDMSTEEAGENTANFDTSANTQESNVGDGESEIDYAASEGAEFQGVRPPKPTALPVLLENLPDELKALDHWVLWDYTWKNNEKKRRDETQTTTEAQTTNEKEKPGKWEKPLFRVQGGGYASANDATTWASFHNAARVYSKGNHSGLGFVVVREDNIVAIDLDDVRDPDSGTLIPDAQSVVTLFDTYTEISPSGTGLRLFLHGRLPAGGRAVKQPHGDKYEAYDHHKYLTVTGQRFDNTPTTINERSAALKIFLNRYFTSERRPGSSNSANARKRASTKELTDDQLLELIRSSKKGARFQQLWEGDLSSCADDDSLADWIFCQILAFWTAKDAKRIDALYRKSRLMRAKWDAARVNGTTTYGWQTIEKAMASCEETYDPFLPDFPELSSEAIPAPAGLDKNGQPVYSARQLVLILYPRWDVAALTTHNAHALRLREYLGDDLRFTPQLGWLHYNGRFWEADDKDATRTAAIAADLSKQVRAETTQLYDLVSVLSRAGRKSDADAMSKAARMHNQHAHKVEDRKFVVDTLHFAAGKDKVRNSAKDFDPKAWVLGFENGVWDRGTWREHRREDYFIYLCPVEIQADALFTAASPSEADPKKSGEWESVLNRISGGDKELERTLQDVAGYILSGASHLPVIPWAYGQRGTGKSTFAVLLQTLLGEGAKTVVPSELRKNADRERFGVKLWNRRLVVCSEAGHQQLDPELLKTLSGSDIFSVRYLFKESFDANPHHVLMLLSNDSPRLDAYDEPLKERILAMPFVQRLDGHGSLFLTGGERIEEVRKNPHSPLMREFAVWALQGMERVYLTGEVYRAPVVIEATKTFWRDTDPLTPFWATVPVERLHNGIFKKELRDLYVLWCESEGQGMKPFTSRPWKRACESIGLVEVRMTKDNKRAWKLPRKPNTEPDSASATNPAERTQHNYNIYGEEIENDSHHFSNYADASDVLIEDLL